MSKMCMQSYYIWDEFLPHDFYKQLEDSLPQFSEVPKVSNRSHRDIFHGDPLYEQLRQQAGGAWKHLEASRFYNREFWIDVLLRTGCHRFSAVYKSVIDLPFIEGVCESRDGVHINKYKDVDQYIYSRFDIGYGLEGYGLVNGGKGPHIDMRQRVVSLVIYFSDQSDFEGGEFERWAGDREDGPSSMVERIPLRKNKAVAVVQDQFGWHAVNPVRECIAGKPRIAIYSSLSVSSRKQVIH